MKISYLLKKIALPTYLNNCTKKKKVFICNISFWNFVITGMEFRNKIVIHETFPSEACNNRDEAIF